MTVLWLDDVRSGDIDAVGGKGASLGELKAAELPVPPGFVVGADSYRSFIEETGIAEELFAAVDVDPEDSASASAPESSGSTSTAANSSSAMPVSSMNDR